MADGRILEKERSRKDKHRILLEHCHFLSAKDVCDKWGISLYTLNKWKSEFGFNSRAYGTFREWVIAALYSAHCNGHGYAAANVAGHLSWINSQEYSEADVMPALEQLTCEGVALKKGDMWFYNADKNKGGEPFIF